jgi:hypothetical protein
MTAMSSLLRRMSAGVALAATLALVVAAALAVLAPTAASAAEPLSPFLTVSGEHLALSLDALGDNNPAGGPIQVEKKDAAETVRAAYLFAASTGETGFVPENGEVTLNGEPIEWEAAHTISSDIGSYNAVANVTSIVKPVVDPASAGLVPLTVAEGLNTNLYDGEILAVVLEDPAVNEARSLTLLYGAQNPEGDTFHVGLAEPIDKSNPSFALNLSLGISYGYQPAGQYSIIEVNNKLMTSSAGGQDDCIEKYSPTPDWGACGNGELITVGGIGDSLEDPPNPAATDEECENEAHEKAPRCDDELYSLLPFVSDGESGITFHTDNPSDNDNIFFGALEVHGGAAVIGEGITLSPATGTNQVGESHTVTASVQNEDGEGVEGAIVHFQVTSGPNEGMTAEAPTSATGKASFTYSSSTAGTDQISAYYVNSHQTKYESNGVSETWEAPVTTPTPTTKTTTTTTTTAATVTTTPTTTPTAKSGVLAFGAAHLASSASACVASTGYLASVGGKLIASVTFTLDGHKVATLTAPNSHGAFATRVKLPVGSKEKLVIKVVFTAASKVHATTITRSLARCAAVHHVSTPRFTG